MNLRLSDRVNIKKEKRLISEILDSKDIDIELNCVGWTSRVYIVDKGKIVFKFPRTEKVKKEYAQEIKILKLLGSSINSVQIPKILWVGDNLNYLGYEGIVGQTFDLVIDKLSTLEKTEIGKQIGDFLKQLHDLDLYEAQTISIQDEISQFQNSYKTALSTINNRLPSYEQSKLESFILKDMPTVIFELGSNPKLCHGDLGYWNLILSSHNKVGIIDWGDVGYYDQSKDFLGMKDKQLLDSALSIYGDNNTLRQKITIRQKVLPILDLVYFIDNKDEEKITNTLKKMQTLL